MTKNHKIRAVKLGYYAEFIAVIYLFFKGYIIIKKNYNSYYGQIDIIALKNKSIIFVEVKARRKYEYLYDALSYKQRDRIKKSAQKFVNSNKRYQNYFFRFDLIQILPYKFPIHIKNAW